MLFRSNPQRAQKLMRERQHLDTALNAYSSLESRLNDAVELIELGEEEGDAAVVADAEASLGGLHSEVQKREAAYPQSTAAIQGVEAKAAALIRDMKALRDDPGLEQITGKVYGRTPSVSREGSRAQALYDKIVATGGFQMLQQMRDASKTGGALGNVSNQDVNLLKASFAALDRRQNTADVRNAIDQAISDIEGATLRSREAYDSTYSYRQGGGKTPAAGGGVDTSNPLLKQGELHGRRAR